MNFLEINNSFCVEGVPLSDIAKDYGTPAYVYSSSQIEKNFNNYYSFLREKDKVCFSVKSNSNIHILQLLSDLGSGFDVVSTGELKKSLIAGGKSENIVFSGIGKSQEDIELALQEKIFSINLESEAELDRIIKIAKSNGILANCSIRINPDISSNSHPFIETGNKSSKFGLSKTIAIKVAERAVDSGIINIIGLASHIGSQISNKELVLENLDYLIETTQELQNKGFSLKTINLGGGFGISYKNEPELQPSEVIKDVLKTISSLDINLVLEPGRSILGNAGILLTKLEYLKETEAFNFAIADSGMNDLLRPSLYGAWHKITTIEKNSEPPRSFNIVGPVCESADIIGKNRVLSLDEDSILAIHDVGAYGYVMSSNYNSRPRPPEILVKDSEVKLIRRRESFEDLISTESNL